MCCRQEIIFKLIVILYRDQDRHVSVSVLAGPEICLSTTIHTYWISICDYQTNECHHGPVWYAAAKKLYSMCAWKSKAELSPPFTRSCVLNDSLGTFWARPWIDEVKMASFVKYCLKAVNPKLTQWKSRAEQGIFTIGRSQTFFGQLGGVQKLRWKVFFLFLTTYPSVDIFYLLKVDILDYLPPSSCQGSLWMPP